MRDITECRRAEIALRESEERLRRLALHQQGAREQERTEVARTIHDDLGQAMSVLEMDRSWLQDHIPTHDQAVRRRLAAKRTVIEGTAELVQRISRDLRPAMLDHLGLIPAVDWLVKDFSARSGVRCQLDAEQRDLEFLPEVATTACRIVQEALTNVARHAQARETLVSIGTEAGILLVTVRDDGRGIGEGRIENRDSLGFLGMVERARSLGGEVQVARHATGGTEVRARIPLAPMGAQS